MSVDFVDRVIRTSIIFIAIVFPFAALYLKIPFALSLVFGCLWGCANLFLIRILVTRTLGVRIKNKFWIVLIIFVKFPLLYFLGYLLLKWKYLSVYGLILGFTAIFVVTVLKVISRSILKAD
ncbi:MAG: hypothetical protein GX409_01005 [candidate division Zixibacteria bacterium]|nr:hypothetical protein [candidate division Zixibacteria bacterium]